MNFLDTANTAIDMTVQEEQPPLANCDSNKSGFLLPPISNGACNSGEINKNQFVQVTSHGSLGIVTASPDALHQKDKSTVVSNNSDLIVSYASQAPRMLTGDLDELDNVSIPISCSIDGVPLATIPSSSVDVNTLIHADSVQVQTLTTPAPVAYVLAMTVEDVSPEQKCLLPEESMSSRTGLQMNIEEPQRTSTPKPKLKDVKQDFNDKILAGNLGIESVTPPHENKVTNNQIEERKLQKKETASRNLQLIDMRKKIHYTEDNKINEVNLDSQKQHNTTYCEEWVSKNINSMPLDNLSLAQSDHAADSTSINLSALNLTSVSRNIKPEYKVQKQDKFISTKKHREITHLQKKTKESKFV